TTAGNEIPMRRDALARLTAESKQFGRSSGVALRNDLIYAADSNPTASPRTPAGSPASASANTTSKVLYRIPDPLEMKGSSAAEGVAVDAMGNVYGGEVGPRQLSNAHSVAGFRSAQGGSGEMLSGIAHALSVTVAATL